MIDEDQNPGAARPTRGRPRIDAGKRRERRIVTFVTEVEFEQLSRLAADSERSLSYVAHHLIVKQLSLIEADDRSRSKN